MAATIRIALAACLASGCFAPVGNGGVTSSGTGTGSSTGSITGTSTGTSTSTGTGSGEITGTSSETDTPTTGEPSQCTWRNLDITGPPARSEHSMVYDSDEDQILLFGGTAGNKERNDLWKFDGTTWTELADATSPPPKRRSHAAAYDPIHKTMVVFGGTSGLVENLLPMNDTQIYDPATNAWNDAMPSMPPKPRYGASMAHYVDTVLLFGGNLNALTPDSEHWSLDGSSWTLLGSSNDMYPKPRSHHMVTLDPSGGLLLYGGCKYTLCENKPYNDTWSWDGMQWILRTETAGDGQLGAMVLHIKEDRIYRFSDTAMFTWDGSTWSPPQPTDVISGVNFAVAYHSIGLIRFGGSKGDANTWVLDCPP